MQITHRSVNLPTPPLSIMLYYLVHKVCYHSGIFPSCFRLGNSHTSRCQIQIIEINIFEFDLYEYQFNQVTDQCFNTLLSHGILYMYEDHTIKCSSCGKSFVSKEQETVCQECSKELENIN